MYGPTKCSLCSSNIVGGIIFTYIGIRLQFLRGICMAPRTGRSFSQVSLGVIFTYVRCLKFQVTHDRDDFNFSESESKSMYGPTKCCLFCMAPRNVVFFSQVSLGNQVIFTYIKCLEFQVRYDRDDFKFSESWYTWPHELSKVFALCLHCLRIFTYDSFHWKCSCIPEIHRIEKLSFLGIAWYKFKLRFWSHLPVNLYRGI